MVVLSLCGMVVIVQLFYRIALWVIAISILVIAYAYLQNTGSLEDFKRVRTLGAGSFGRVILCQHLGNKHFYAIKVLDKAKARHCIITVTSLTSQTIGVRK